MDRARLIFDPSSSRCRHEQRMLLLGGGGGGSPVFGGARSALAAAEGANKRRPFFTSPEELLEEEYYYDEQQPDKKRRLSPEQVRLLERSFEAENKLEPERKSELALKLGMQPRQVAVWFQNRRARWKTKQLEHDFDSLKSSYGSLLSDHDSLLKENDRLRSQVISLTEKLQSRTAASAAAAGIAGTKSDVQAAASVADPATLVVQTKAEDRLSAGSGGSAVVDGEAANQLVDSSEVSYREGCHCMGPVDGGRVQSEEDDGSDEGCNYYSDGIFAAEHHHQDEVDAQLDWWVWS
ncbi:hypothetical protein OPV22_011304 [Ensete ventricosum]|uniref:Homeobox-leucine zipper protein n=1 Tax=Ensete ventricosum TaxID=4639 RepID=A0AAV8RHK0_ENSVE|nr:hypothetical protein OPV22_011304 [Ensete ventricosum]